MPANLTPEYLEAESATRFLGGLGGEAQLRRLLSRLGRGEDFAEAFAAVYGTSVTEFEDRWRSSLSTGSGALDWVRAVLARTTLFTYVALLVIVAFVVQYIRRRRRKERMDLDPWP